MDIVRHQTIHSGPPPARPPTSVRRRLGWRWLPLLLVLSCLAAVAAPVAWWLGWPMVRDTMRADDAPASPSEALLEFVYTFTDDPDSDVGVGRLVVPEKRRELFELRREYLHTMRDTPTVTGHRPGPFDICAGPAGDDGAAPRIDGDTAAVGLWVCVEWFSSSGPVVPGGAALRGASRLWTAETRRSGGGWRLWSVWIPSWCGDDTTSGYARCA